MLNHPIKDTSTPETPSWQDSEAKTSSSKLRYDDLSTDLRDGRTYVTDLRDIQESLAFNSFSFASYYLLSTEPFGLNEHLKTSRIN